MPFFCFLSGWVLFLLQRTWLSLGPAVAQVLTPASFSARRSSWKVPPGVYGMRQYGLYSSSDRSTPRKGRTSNRLSGVSVCLHLCLFLFVMRLFVSALWVLVGGL